MPVVVFTESNGSSEFLLSPVERDAASDTDMDIDTIVAFDNLLGLDKVRGMSLFVHATAVESSAGHKGASFAEIEVGPGIVCSCFFNLSRKTLDYRYRPT